MKIVLFRCPQPLLIGESSGALYSPNRSVTPEPTLPQLHGIIAAFAKQGGHDIQVVQTDLRDPQLRNTKEVVYGKLTLPYINESLKKVYTGIPMDTIVDTFQDADVIGFSNNFGMSRGVVCRHIAWVRNHFPTKEIWVGGRDVFTQRVIDVYAQAAGNKNLVVWHGHVYDSLPSFLRWRLTGVDAPFGITTYDTNGLQTFCTPKPLGDRHGHFSAPLPIYPNPEAIGRFTGSGEGAPNPPFGRFVHATFSVGCPYDCGYCTTGYRERYLVCKDMPTIIAELDMYQQLGVTHLAIMDDNLLALGPAKIVAIMNEVNKRGFAVEFGNGLQLKLLAKWWGQIAEPVMSNCVSLYCPLEDLTQDTLYQKLDPTDDQLTLMKKIAHAKFANLRYVTMGVVHGVPGHTKEKLATTFLQNVRRFLDVFHNSPLEVAVTVFNFMALPGTQFGEVALNSGRMVVADPFAIDPEVCSFGTTSYAPEGMTHTEVFHLYEEALNLNPAGKQLGLDYTTIQCVGDKALPPDERHLMPPNWRVPGYHLRAQVKK